MHLSYRILCEDAQGNYKQFLEDFAASLPDAIPKTGPVLGVPNNPAVARTLALLKGPSVRRPPRTIPDFANDDTPAALHPEQAAPVTFLDGEPAKEPAEPDAAKVRKKGRVSRSRRDPLASLVFVGEFLTTTGIFPLPEGVRPSVCMSKGSPTPSHKPSKNLHFLEKRIRTAPTIPGTTTKKPPTWRDLDDHAQAVFAFEGLRDHGPITGFTANLTEEISARAYGQEKPGSWLHKQLREQFNKAFDRPVDFLMHVEEKRAPITGKLKFHVHGVIGQDLTARRQADKTRAAMRAAFGIWERTGKGSQIEFNHQIDVGWPSYCAKGARWATPFMRALMADAGHTSLAPSFAGPVMTMTQGTTRLAKVAVEEARRVVIEARTRSAAVARPLSVPKTAKPANGPFKRFVAILLPVPQHQSITLRAWGNIRQVRLCRALRSVANRSTGPPRRA